MLDSIAPSSISSGDIESAIILILCRDASLISLTIDISYGDFTYTVKVEIMGLEDAPSSSVVTSFLFNSITDLNVRGDSHYDPSLFIPKTSREVAKEENQSSHGLLSLSSHPHVPQPCDPGMCFILTWPLLELSELL